MSRTQPRTSTGQEGVRPSRVAGWLALAFGVAHLVVAAPYAAAQELAPGLSCDGLSCRNDTEDTYRVRSDVTCETVGTAPTIRQAITVTTHIRPHTTATVAVACPPQRGPSTLKQQPPERLPDGRWEHKPPILEPGGVVASIPRSVWHRDPEVDNNPPVPTGSFG